MGKRFVHTLHQRKYMDFRKAYKKILSLISKCKIIPH